MMLDQAAIARYQRDGAVLVERVFADWVDSLSAALSNALRRCRTGDTIPRDPRFRYQNEPTIVEPFGGGAMALNVMSLDSRFSRWLDESPAAELVATAMGSRTSRFWVDASFVKDQGKAAEGTPWHNDTCTWPFWGNQMVILWIALSDISLDDGPLTTVRGSHHGDGRYYSPFFPPSDDPPPPYKPWERLIKQTRNTDKIETWTMRRGDCLLLHPSTIHGSAPRMAKGDGHRVSFSTRWLGDDAVWNPDSLTAPMTTEFIDDPAMIVGSPPPESVLPITWAA